MQSARLTSLRRARWLPILSSTMGFILLAGPIFHCCRFNESVSASIRGLVASLIHSTGNGSTHPHLANHPACHGHREDAQPQTLSAPHDGKAILLEEDGHCLSETATPKAIASTVLENTGFFPDPPHRLPVASAPLISHSEQPKPRDKSSPPVYLLTRRLLV